MEVIGSIKLLYALIKQNQMITKGTKMYYSINKNGLLVVDDLNINRSLDLSDTEISKLPDNLSIKGNLGLGNTQMTELPNGLIVNGWLDISNTKISKLPKGLIISDNLDISNTQITELPNDLIVGGWLDLRDTKITNYPISYGCGDKKRAIYLDLKDKTLIQIGCFKGTKKEAIAKISIDYSGKAKFDYIAKVNECFNKGVL